MVASKQARAVIYRRFGKPSVLELVDDTTPTQAAENRVLVQTRAVSVNPKDTLLRSGKFNGLLARQPLPRGVGLDASGVVVAVGANVNQLKPGDSVFGMTNQFCGGLLRDFIELDQNELALAPSSIPLTDAAALPLAALTAFQALTKCSQCTPETKLMIVGATGGVGHFAVQIGAILGAEVTAICHSNNQDFARSLGANRVVCYDQEDPRKLKQQFDIIFDVAGKCNARQFSNQLTKNGVYISTVPSMRSVFAELSHRLHLSQRSRLVIVKSKQADLEKLSAWVDKGQLRPVVSQRFTIEQVQQAHTAMQSGHTRGKLVIEL